MKATEEVSLENCNKIIAEFMGFEWRGQFKERIKDLPYLKLFKNDQEYSYCMPYSHSLDALVPVWQKLDWNYSYITFFIDYKKSTCRIHSTKRDIDSERYTIQEAAAIATAKAIQEMGK